MAFRVVVWGTGNVGRPAIRAITTHRDLELVGVVVSNPAKVGRDAGELAGIAPLGVVATADSAVALAADVDCVFYAATADTRPTEAYEDLFALLRAGRNVVSTSFYPLLHPPSAPRELLDLVEPACTETGASVFVSGTDPGWLQDILPALISGVGSGITEIRAQELMNYAQYDSPDTVRNFVGLGAPMDTLPPMLQDETLKMVWAPVLRVLADALEVEIDEITTAVERRPLERDVDVDGMGRFEAGTLGAFRIEVSAVINGNPRFVVEHVTRIDDECAPNWPYPIEADGEHRVLMSGHPNLAISIHGSEPGERGTAAAGCATATNRCVNAIPAVCRAPGGVVDPADLPPITGGAQLAP